jgi:hypothetical protein
MKAKLTKITGIYTLLDDNDRMVASDDVDMQKDYEIGKLSTKNCDEIFKIIDVEKLAEESWGDKISSPYHAYIEGFNKAMELNKDKVFTLEDMKKAINLAYVIGKSDDTYQECEKFVCEQLQSIQQPTEIEVTIEMECLVSGSFQIIDFSIDPIKTSGEVDLGCVEERPKLDSEGCLILKRVV